MSSLALNAHKIKIIVLQLSILIGYSTASSLAQSFKEISESTGITHYQHDPYYISGGVAIFDFNNDGYEDLYFTGGLKPGKLYENVGSASFVDVSDIIDSDVLKTAFTQGVAIGDVNNDGYDDIFITTHKGYGNILLLNFEGKRFIDASGSLKSNLRNVWSTSATMADVDMDGDLDIYVGNFVDYNTESFKDESISATIPNSLYINKNGSFIDEAAGFNVANEGSTLAVSFTDVNNDSHPDVYVGNDHGKRFSPNALYINNPPGNTFERAPAEMGADVAINSMGIAIGDYDEDEDLDYYITHIWDNVLLNNNFNLTKSFSDQSLTQAVPSRSGISWGTVFFDYNNDTYLDLYVANGDMLGIDIPQENILYQRKNGKYINVSNIQGVADVSRCRGVASGDIDNDGQVDLAVVAVSAEDDYSVNNTIYQNKNNSTGHWVKVKLEGLTSNRNGYGSWVKVFAGDRVFTKEVDGGSSYLSHNSSILHFGLGQTQTIDSMEVRWPGGHKELYRSLAADRLIYLREGDNAYYVYHNMLEKECEKDSVLIFGEYRTLPGFYRDTIQNEAFKEIHTTLLRSPRVKLAKCNNNDEKLEESKDVAIYPNPFDDDLSIMMRKMGDYDAITIHILGSTGNQVLKLAITPRMIEDNTIKITGDILKRLGPGLYLVNIYAGPDRENALFSEKILRY
ncbi:MAG: CRTAC1 family protein [Cytophagales bacterium]|nr:CRTAC1 family protein [Cytophagales bacterium]